MALQPLLRRLPHPGLLRRAASRSTTSLKQLSQGARSGGPSPSQLLGSRRSWFFLAGLGTCAGAAAAWRLSRSGEESRVSVLPIVKAGGQDGEAKEKEKPKISGRELRYKAFASYVYKGEPYMSARDFLESFIRDEPRCELLGVPGH